jgi:hypothetical protein
MAIDKNKPGAPSGGDPVKSTNLEESIAAGPNNLVVST